MSRTSCIFSCLAAVCVSTCGFGRELPKLECGNPQPNTRYDYLSSVAVLGRLTGLSKSTVHIRIEHVQPDGRVLRQVGIGGIPTSDSGQFAVTMNPPASGWLPGKNRVVLQLDRISHVTKECDFEVVAPNQERIVQYSLPPKSSGAVIDIQKNINGGSVPMSRLFLVRGEFPGPNPADPLAPGPSVLASLILKGVTMNSRANCSLWDAATNQYWYEIQIKMPEEKGLAVLEVTIPKRGPDGKNQPEKLQIPIAITDEDPLAVLR